MNKMCSKGMQWAWSELTESIHADRKAGTPIWEWHRLSCPMSWFSKGYVIEIPIGENK